MSDKLALSGWGLHVSAEGLWGLGAAIVIVAIVAGVIVLCRNPPKDGRKISRRTSLF